YTLLDFGRRSSETEIARQHLVAANFAFDRKIQDVVFGAERTFYALDAAHAAVLSAKRNLELAQTDLGAVKESLDNGLATQPELLLAKERVAQSRYDLANARLIVREAQANLAVALGVAANTPIKVQTLESQAVPKALSGGVDELIQQTIAQRPDLAASVAGLRAREAAIKRAAAQWYPVVSLGADYGQRIWSYTLNGTAASGTNEPFYSALINLKWDVFTGFKRRNDDIRADAQLRAASADVKSLELTAIAQIWQAYFQFESAREKYRYGQALLASAKEAYDANIQTYRNGLSTIVELLTAQSDLANARYTFIQSKADLLTSYAAVAYAAGAIQTPPS
ncbi:MAG: TolC family protein, partial [Candidatus Binataceae bacterium]